MATEVITMKLLSPGTHANPRQGCNLLELASVLSFEPWSTWPRSVHPALAAAARAVNDLMTDDRRRLLVPLAPWLLGTNSADSRVWPAVTMACLRVAGASAGPDEQAQVRACCARAQQLLDHIGRERGGPLRSRIADFRNRGWSVRASCSALERAAGAASDEIADATLSQALVSCVNSCRRLTGARDVSPLLPLDDCPSRLAVRLCVTWSAGCDWMETGYEPVPLPREHVVRVAGQRSRQPRPAVTVR
ncbi:MAG TPA: hypothetical protein VFQ44_04530 [Streptosporangiaceae bacterium]|nr:hypothetical protein [Streptosporangiaceae bacterium]